MKAAERALKHLNEVLEEIDSLKTEDADKLAVLLKEVHGHAMSGEPEEPPLGLDWCLAWADVCEILYSRITGISIDLTP